MITDYRPSAGNTMMVMITILY